MKYPFSEDEYIDIQRKVYQKQLGIVSEGLLPNIELKIIERGIFFRPPKEFKERKYTVNVYNWLFELNELRHHIIHESLLCLACERAAREFEAPYSGTIRYLDRERYFKLFIYDLFSYRERIGFLIYELLNRDLNIKDKRKVTFSKVCTEVIKMKSNKFEWLSNAEFSLIVKCLKRMCNSEYFNYISNLRHAYTHRSAPGVDCLSMRIHDYHKLEGSELQIQREFSKRQGDADWAVQNFEVVSDKPSEYEVEFEVAYGKAIKTWRELITVVKQLIAGVEVIGSEIKTVHFELGSFDAS